MHEKERRENSVGARHLEQLIGQIRPEYRSELLLTPPKHPVFSQGDCPIEGCRNAIYGSKNMCPAHYQRHSIYKQNGGTLSLDEWRSDQEANGGGLRELPRTCDVRDCRLGRSSASLCWRHYRRWVREGKPVRDKWAATVIFDPSIEAGRPDCAVAACDVMTTGNSSLCVSHRTNLLARRSKGQRLTEPEYIWLTDHRGVPRLDLQKLPRALTLEVQYAVQSWGDQEQSNVRIDEWSPVIRLLADSGAESILDRSEVEWRAAYADALPRHTGPAVFLSWLHEVVDVLINGTGWATEYARDIWRLGRLGRPEAKQLLRFDRIEIEWLRALCKRWSRHRVGIARSANTLVQGVNAISAMSKALLELGTEIPRTSSNLTRDHLEHVMASNAFANTSKNRARRVSLLNVFLTDVHRFSWAPDLSSSVVVYKEDFPKKVEQAPRALDEFLMRQMEHPANFAKFADPQARLVTELMINCGLRSKDALRLELDCIVRSDGHPYLRYLNHKLNRTAFVPLDEKLADHIKAQQERALDRFPHGNPVLFPRKNKNVSGRHSMSRSVWRGGVKRWLAEIELHDEHGRPVDVKPHQYRHTFGTRLINLDVDQHTVQRLLDHASPDMTAHYARLRSDKLREGWEKARKINIRGEEVDLPADHPLAEVTWLRAGVERAKQTLPNGYCGMPAHSPCEHANPCLTCPLFITTPEFLPQHQTQHRKTLELIQVAKTNGHDRVVEKNVEVAQNLDRIIRACENCGDGEIVAGGQVQGESNAG